MQGRERGEQTGGRGGERAARGATRRTELSSRAGQIRQRHRASGPMLKTTAAWTGTQPQQPPQARRGAARQRGGALTNSGVRRQRGSVSEHGGCGASQRQSPSAFRTRCEQPLLKPPPQRSWQQQRWRSERKLQWRSPSGPRRRRRSGRRCTTRGGRRKRSSPLPSRTGGKSRAEGEAHFRGGDAVRREEVDALDLLEARDEVAVVVLAVPEAVGAFLAEELLSPARRRRRVLRHVGLLGLPALALACSAPHRGGWFAVCLIWSPRPLLRPLS